MADLGNLEIEDFETYVRFSDKAARDDATRTNDAFVAAINAAIKRGKEKVKFETIVDSTPPIGHRRIRGEVIFSSCGSPAAMCGAPSFSAFPPRRFLLADIAIAGIKRVAPGFRSILGRNVANEVRRTS